MLSLQEISDRLEIQQLLVDYSTAIDQRRFDDLDAVFTPDAYIDYRAMGGIDGQFPEVKAWLARGAAELPGVLAHARQLRRSAFAGGHRDVADDLLQPDGARRARRSQIMFCGLWYDDEFVRTADGWRMTRRVETKCFDKII